MERFSSSGRAAVAMLAVAGLLTFAGCDRVIEREESVPGLNGPIDVRVWSGSERGAQLTLEAARANVAQARRELGSGVDGDLDALNLAAADGFHAVESFNLYRAVLLALDWAKATGGAYDPTVTPVVRLYNRPGLRPPSDNEVDIARSRVGWRLVTVASESQAFHFRTPGMALDLAGVADGFQLDIAVRAFARGAVAGEVRTGGLAYAWGDPPDAEGLWVDLVDPRDGSGNLGRVLVRARGVAVEGQRRDARPHLFDPRTGRPAGSDLEVAVIVADTAGDAAAAARGMYVLGSTHGGELLRRTRRVEAVLVVSGNGPTYVLASASLRGRLEISPGLLEEASGGVRYLLPPAELKAF